MAGAHADYPRRIRKWLAAGCSLLSYGPFLFYLLFRWLEVVLDPEGDE